MTAISIRETVKQFGDWKEAAAWTGVGLCALALWLFATFPYDALQGRLVGEVRRMTGMDVRVADWSVGIPLGLEWRNVTLSKPPWDPVRLAVIEAKVGVLKTLTGGAGLELVARVDEEPSAGGFAKGTITASSWSFTGPVSVKGHVQQVDLSKLLRRYVRHGVLTGDFAHRLDPSQAGGITGDGSWKLTVKDLSLDDIPVTGGRTLALTFSGVSAGLACHDAACTVTEFKGDGLDGTISGDGTITLQRPLQNSQLALTVTVVPGAGFSSKAMALGLPPLPPGTPMTFKIAGTLAQPRLSL